MPVDCGSITASSADAAIAASTAAPPARITSTATRAAAGCHVATTPFLAWTFAGLREPLRAICAELGLKGSVLLAQEGINGTVAGTPDCIDAFVGELQHGALFGGRLDNLELKFSSSSTTAFGRMKVRLKKEIVTLGDPKVDPTQRVSTYVDPAQ